MSRQWCKLPRNDGAITVGGALLCSLVLSVGAAGCSKRIVLGEQCPSPGSGMAEVEGLAERLGSDGVYGTTCAPCDDGEEPSYAENGCPIFVTFDSCGGDVCVGLIRIEAPSSDGGLPDAALMDGGESDDAGEEDASEPDPMEDASD